MALSCLVQQLKVESRADVFTVVRKLRSQRHGMVQDIVSTDLSGEIALLKLMENRASFETFVFVPCPFQSQYRFIYRAIADYVELYHSRDDEEYEYSVPINSVNSICRPPKKPTATNASPGPKQARMTAS